MADNIKISELVELTSGSLSDATIFPVVDGGSTKKASLSSLQSYLTDDLATDAELSSQISNVNSTISGLTTDNITEGDNLYLTDSGIDERLNTKSVVSSSAQVQDSLGGSNIVSSSNQISASAAASGFGAGGGGTSNYNDLTNVPTGIVSSSAQTIANLGSSTILSGSISSTDVSDFTTAVSSSAAASGFGGGEGGGGGSSDYVSNVTFSGTTLTFTGVGNAFGSGVDLSGEGLAAQLDVDGKLAVSTYNTDSASFASRIGGGGGGGSVPSGTVSSSAQTIEHINTINVISSSAQVVIRSGDLTNFTTDDIAEGTINKYGTNANILSYINSIGVTSGSGGGGGFDVSGTNIVSSSTQIETLGFITNGIFGTATASLQSQIDGIDSGVNLNDVNVFLAKQKFTQDIEVTGSLLLNNGSFSGSGAQLSNIPASAVVGLSSTNTLTDGSSSLAVVEPQGITATVDVGNFTVNLDSGGDLIVSGGHFFAASGSTFSGSGAGLTGIPGSAIDGGVDGQKIASSSFSASIEDGTGNFVVGPPAIFESTISASGEITAQSISVGTSGTPTIYSSNNLNLSSSGTVVVTDSALRLNPLTDTQTGSLTIQTGDMIFSNDSNDFYGYRIVNQTGSWYSLTEGTVSEVEWDTLIGVPSGLVSASSQITSLGGGLLSSSAQLLPSGAAVGTVYFEDTLDNISGSSDFTYTAGTRTLNVNKVVANELVYNTSLTGAGNDTGSYGRVETDALNINSAIEFPTSDGTINQVLKTDGNGNLDFADFADVLGNDNISSNGTITMGTGSINTNLSVGGTLNLGTPVHSTFSNLTTTVDAANVNILSSGSLILSSSVNVTIQDVLVLPEVTVKPTNPQSGSIITSGSGVTVKPYFWDGANWQALY
jgi:hypothetical protein